MLLLRRILASRRQKVIGDKKSEPFQRLPGVTPETEDDSLGAAELVEHASCLPPIYVRGLGTCSGRRNKSRLSTTTVHVDRRGEKGSPFSLLIHWLLHHGCKYLLPVIVCHRGLDLKELIPFPDSAYDDQGHEGHNYDGHDRQQI